MSPNPNSQRTPCVLQPDLPAVAGLQKRRLHSLFGLLLSVISLIAAGILCRSLRAQADGAPSAFEVVSVKAARPGTGGMSITSDPGRLTLRNVTLRFCIQAAYHVKDYQLSGGSGWINTEAYDIDAKAPGPATPAEMYLMLQPVLAGRFKLAVHWETQEGRGYALLIGTNGPRLREAENGEGAEMRVGRDRLTARKVPIARFSEALSNILERPVVDMTGLSGVFDIDLKWLPDDRQAVRKPGMPPTTSVSGDDASGGPSIFGAVQDQLGLKLEARKLQVRSLVIDSAKKPDAN